MRNSSRVFLTALLATGLLGAAAACSPEMKDGRFRCDPEAVEPCPPEMACLPLGIEFQCFRQEAEGICGNFLLEPGEQCDGESAGAFVCDTTDPAVRPICSADCLLVCARCGNGVLETTASGEGEECDDGNLRSHDGCSSGCTTELPLWSREAVIIPLRGRVGHVMAYDAHRDHILLYGGQGGHPDYPAEQFGDWWTGLGDAWTQGPPLGDDGPGASPDSALAYEAHLNRMVLFEGRSMETWYISGDDWIRGSVAPPDGVVGRNGPLMTYDASRQAVVLVGGIDTEDWSTLDDTWELAVGQWQQRALSSPAPACSKWVCQMTYFPRLGQVVLVDSRACIYAYDGTEWQEVGCPDPGSGPSERTGFVLAADPLRQRLVLFGGITPDGTFLNDTWEHDGVTWIYQDLGTVPPARAWATATADASGITLAGGYDGVLLKDIWRYEAGTWRQHRPWEPGELLSGFSIYHEGLQRSVVLTIDRQQWFFDGATWHNHPGGLPVEVPVGAAIAYDPVQARLVQYGGFDDLETGVYRNETWTFDGTDWSELPTAHHPPTPQLGYVMTWDPERDCGVLIGEGAIWELCDGDWRRRDVPWSVTDIAESLDYDARRKAVVAFGFSQQGMIVRNAVWLYDGERVQELPLPEAVELRRYGSVIYDANLGQGLLFGGQSPFSGDYLSDLWRHDGRQWSQLPSLPDQDRLGSVGLVYDIHRRSMILVFEQYSWQFQFRSNHPDEICDNDEDDDDDFLVDAQDPDCNLAPLSAPQESCVATGVPDDSTDDDGDGLTGCADPNCAGVYCGPHGLACFGGRCTCPWGYRETRCGNELDDDCDGLVDCDDPDCAPSPFCPTGD